MSGQLSAFGAWFLGTFARGQAPVVTSVELGLILAGAAALSIPQATWRYFGLVSTVVHELGHACSALMVGRRVTGITLKLDSSGTTTSFGRGGFRSVWAGFWGYPVPAVIGAGLVWAGLTGWGPAAMSAGTAVMVLTVLFIRNAAGLLILLGTIAAAAGLILLVPPEFTGHLVVGLGLALLVGSVRDLLNVTMVHLRHRHRLESSDAYLLSRRTSVPSAVWLFLFTVVIGGSWFLAWRAAGAVVAAL
ncbi:M50 family metallopeptidase [Arthrobacter sp. TMN-37]